MPPTPPLPPLPIDPFVPRIVEALGVARAVVVQAPPGAGKTTRVPPALLALPRADARARDVIVLEPRRLAARWSARRVAEERGERPGETVGWDVRFERVIGPGTRLQFVTEGVLVRRLLDDPDLAQTAVVVLDEFHERHLQGDLALAVVRRLQRTTRPDLKLVAMSATLDAAPLAKFLDAPIMTSEGRLFEVTIDYPARADDRPLAAQVTSAVRRAIAEAPEGDVLVFLPGAGEIRRAMEACARVAADANLVLVPLHGDLSPALQDRAITRADRRKVILSTNVAETSVTIEGVVAVIDSGLARVAGHDAWSGRPTLDVAKISRASAAQRAGRAGRVRAGIAYRLYTKGDHDTRRAHDFPEITRADLAEAVLQLRALGVDDPTALEWLDPPPADALTGARALLRRLGALDAGGALTTTGRAILRLPLHPRIARVVVEAEARGVADEGCAIGAILAEGRDLFTRSFEEEARAAHDDATSDVLLRLDALREVIADGDVDRDRARRIGVDATTAGHVNRARLQLLRTVARDRAPRGDVDELLRIALLAGYPDRVARRRASEPGRVGASREVVLASGGSATLGESCAVRTAPWLIAIDARETNGRLRVSTASAIAPEWLIDLFPDAVRESTEVTWNGDLERVEAVERLVYDRLALDERPAGGSADDAATALLVERACAVGLSAFVDGDALDRLRRRIALVVEVAPDLAGRAGLVPLDEERLREILVRRCAGKRSFAELRDGTLLEETFLDEIWGWLGRAARARLDELVPESIALPSGRRVQIGYPAGQAPSIASRLQDFFGSTETPRIVEGRVPLVIHLLAPNGRDVQITTDLAGFWARTWPSVRSELARRYPRHAWPADPISAAPPPPRRR